MVTEPMVTEPMVIRGNPTDEELAAVVAALATLTRPTPAPTERRPTGWSAYWRTLPTQPRPSATPWRTSLRPT